MIKQIQNGTCKQIKYWTGTESAEDLPDQDPMEQPGPKKRYRTTEMSSDLRDETRDEMSQEEDRDSPGPMAACDPTTPALNPDPGVGPRSDHEHVGSEETSTEPIGCHGPSSLETITHHSATVGPTRVTRVD